MARSKIYISPSLARRFSDALDTCHVIMFSAPMSSGKTVVARELLRRARVESHRLSCASSQFSSRLDRLMRDLRSSEVSLDGAVILVDDLGSLEEGEKSEQLQRAIEANPLLRFVLCGHCTAPSWVTSLEASHLAVVFGAEDLVFDDSMFSELLSDRQVSLGFESRRKVLEQTLGYPPLILFVVDSLQSHGTEDGLDDILDHALHALGIKIEHEMNRRYTVEERDFLYSLAAFESFSSGLAEAISDNGRGVEFLERAKTSTRMIVESPKGVLRFWPMLKSCLIDGMNTYWDEKRRLELFARGAIYFDSVDNYAEAVRCYSRLGDEEKVCQLLIRAVRSGVSHDTYRDLSPYYLDLPRALVLESPDLMFALSMTNMLRSEFDDSTDWYRRLSDYAKRDDIASVERRQAERYVARLDIELVHHPLGTVEGTISYLSRFVHDGSEPFSVSLTGDFPSVLNGWRDFSPWDVSDAASCKSLRKIAMLVLGGEGLGLADVGHLETRFFRGEDVSSLAVEVAAILAEVHLSGSADVEFAAVALLALIEIDQGNARQARRLIDALRGRYNRDGHASFLPNIDAFDCRLAMLTGDLASVRRWEQQASRLVGSTLWVQDRYQHMTLAAALMALGHPEKAIEVLAPWRENFERTSRVVDRIELEIFSAIACLRIEGAGGVAPLNWDDELCHALDLAREHGFVRVVSQIGVAVIPLLELTSWDADPTFLSHVLRRARRHANFYRTFLAVGEEEAALLVPTLTKTETRVLELLAKDMSNAEIMAELNIKLPTVKAHVLHIMKKLGARSRGQAKTIGMELGLV